MTQEALKLAEDYAHMRAIWYVESLYGTSASHTELREKVMLGAHQALKEALAQTQEPVALPCCGYRDASAVKWNPLNDVVQCHNCGQTYTPSPQRTWQGLTDEEIDKAWRSVDYTVPWEQHRIDIAKAIEAKLKQKNGFAEEKNT
jgi:hypothetical protein